MTSGIDHFELTGTLSAVRINKADPFCSPPIETQNTTVAISETLPGTATEFSVPFPPLPQGDGWFVSLSEVRLRAFDSTGTELGTQGGGGTTEAICSRPATTSTPIPRPVLPSTGSGGGQESTTSTTVLLLTGSALVVLAGVVFAMRRRVSA